MHGIPIYAADCQDFSTNGLGFLLPTECTVEEEGNGLYELRLVQPISDDFRWAQAVNGRILKAVCPARESPEYEREAVDEPQHVTRTAYKVNTVSTGLRLRQQPSLSAQVLSLWPRDTDVIGLEAPEGDWVHVTIKKGGQTGYMWRGYLRTIGSIDVEIEPEKPVGSNGVHVSIAREQLFRIYSVENDTETGLQTVKALHIFYDLRGSVINETYEPDGVQAAEAAQHVMSASTEHDGFTLHASRLTGSVTGKYDFCSPIEAWLEPDDGILAQANGVMFRDNFDVHLLPDSTRDMGVTIRRGKNLIGVTVTTDDSDVTTRIIPCGKDKNGDPLFLNYAKDKNGDRVPGARVFYIESPSADAVGYIRTRKVDYDVQVKSGTEFPTVAKAREELERLAYKDFEGGCDKASYGLEVDFVMLGQNVGEDLSDWARLQAVHLFDTVTVIDELVQLWNKLRVTGYVWDVLTEQYESLKLGDVTNDKQTIYSYNIPTGGISGTKIAPGTASGDILRSATIQYAKIEQAAIERLAANSLTALEAHIAAIQAGEIDVDDLYADLAKLARAEITTANISAANIDWAQISSLSAEVASIARAQLTTANINSATIDWASITNLAAAVASIADARIENATITAAQIEDLSATVAAIADARIKNATIETGQISNLSATVAEIADAEISKATIHTAQIDDLSAHVATIENGIINNATIADASVTTAKIVDLAVTGAKIDDLAVTTAKIAQAAITTAKIEDAAITSAKVGDAQIGTAKIALGAITSALIDAGAVGTAQIADGSITDAKIVTLTANKINAGTLSVERLIIRGSDQGLIYAINNMGQLVSQQVDTIDGYVLTERTITADKIVAHSITANELAAHTITANEILAGTITGAEIAAATIEGSNIKAGTLTTSHVASDFGETLDLSSNAGINQRVEKIYADMDAVVTRGRNLLIGTAQPINLQSGISPAYAMSDYGLSMTAGDTTGDYTISMDWAYTWTGEGEPAEITGDPYFVYRLGGTQTWGSRSEAWPHITAEALSGRVESVVRLSAAQAANAGKRVEIRLYNPVSGYTLTVSNLKFEKGERATEWTEAPEEVEDALETQLQSINARISNMGESIQSEVRASYALKSDLQATAQTVQTLSQQTQENFTWSVAQINQLLGETEGLTEEQARARDTLQTMLTYMRFDQSGMTIGKSGSELTLRATNDRLSFYSNETEVAYISNNRLFITEAQILTRMTLGRFGFEPQSNGNLSLIFNG